MVLGVVLNVFALGLTGFLYDAFMQPNADTLNNPGVLQPINIPVLSHIPVLGPLLFQANIVVYLTYVLIIVIDVWLFRTRWGLRTRAVGEHPKAADTVGIKVLRDALPQRRPRRGGGGSRWGVLHHRLGRRVREEHHRRPGLHRARRPDLRSLEPPRSRRCGAAVRLRLRAADVLSINARPIPSNFLAMLPYVATIFAVAGLVGRVRAPAADGEPYVKG